MTKPPRQYAPGPYRGERTSEGCDDYYKLYDATGEYVASIWFWDDTSEDADRAEANAQLLVMAPDLVELLQALLATCRALGSRITNRRLARQLDKAEAVVALATGLPVARRPPKRPVKRRGR